MRAWAVGFAAMPRDIREPYRFSLSIASRLQYDEGETPAASDLKDRAKRFAIRVQRVLADEFRGEVQVRTEYARPGSAYFGHGAELHLESREEWERACRVFSQFTDDWEDIFRDQWVQQEFLARDKVKIRIAPHTRHATSADAPQAPPPLPPPALKSDTDDLRRAQRRVKRAMRSERKRTRRLLFNMGWAALAFGLVLSAAAWNYWFLSEQVRLLRTEIAAREPIASPPAAPAPQVVVTYPPGQVRIIEPAPQERRTRTYSTGP